MRVPLTASQRTGEYGSDGSSDMWEGYGSGGLSPEASGADGDDWEPMDMGGFPTGLDLVGVCLRTVVKDPEIILLQLLSFAFSLSLLIIYLQFVLGDLTEGTLADALAEPVFLLVLFPFSVVAGAVGVFFRAASIVIASIRLRGGDPVARDGLVAAGRRLHLIVAWAVINSVVSVGVAILRRNARGASRLVVEGANLAWAVATYFVVPAIVFESLGPLDAIDRSTSIVRRTWREALGGNFGIGFVMLMIALPGFFLYPVGAAVWGTTGGIGFVFAYWLFVMLFSGAVESVLVAALYQMAKTGERPAGFDGYTSLSDAFSTVRPVKDRSVPRSVDEARDSSLMFSRR